MNGEKGKLKLNQISFNNVIFDIFNKRKIQILVLFILIKEKGIIYLKKSQIYFLNIKINLQ